jgi:hypothetical protein
MTRPEAWDHINRVISAMQTVVKPLGFGELV